MVGVRAWLTEAASKRLLALSGQNLDVLIAAAHERSFRPVPLGIVTGMKLGTKVRRYQTANVIGAIVGRDSALRDQAVVYTAHHDHLGASERGGKSVIFNGALDNAAGVAQLLSVARAFRARRDAPRRTVLFLAVAAEEQGLLGSAYYAAHPTFAPSRIAANINFDGGNIWGRTYDIAAVGYGKSTLDRVAQAAAQRQGRTYVDEAFPERGGFYRSDQFNFAKIGVPALFLRPGTNFVGRPADWGREQMDAWLSAHYHQPSDDYDPVWDLGGMIDDARVAFAMGAMIADADDTPTWVPGDEFEAVRKASAR
jgi:Zn-dependent M28 family amino/carboxypeptidase